MDTYQILEVGLLLITAIATSFYAYLTWKLAQPLISVMLEPDENDNLSMNLVIENVGSGIAYDVNFFVSPDFQIINGRYISQIGLFKNGFPIFSPHTKMRLYLTWMPENYEEKIKTPLDIKIEYKNRVGWKYKQQFKIDFFLFGEVPLSENPLMKLADNLEKIKNNVSAVTTHFDRLKVVVYTKDEDLNELYEGIELTKKE